MIKDHIRDYATEAFRTYASLGKPTHDDLREHYFKKAMSEYQKGHEKGPNVSKPTENQVIYAESRLQEKMAELLDVLAVEKAMVQLHEDEKRAVELVYFQHPRRDLKRNEISERVTNASTELYCDIRTIYRYLKKARMIFAYERNLRR